MLKGICLQRKNSRQFELPAVFFVLMVFT
jgi:hypothetical protein